MNNYEEKKQARIERMEQRISRLRQFAEGKDLSLFSEEKSSIPMGQPILVGHHSERRHRRHLERIDNLVRKGYDASKKADQLEDRLESIKRNNQIQVDNPDAKELIQEKINKLQSTNDKYKKINALIRKSKGDVRVLAEFLEVEMAPKKKTAMQYAEELMKPDFAGRIGIPSFTLTNNGAEIRRLKKRLVELERISEGFENFAVGLIEVELNDGQIQIEFPKKPDEASRDRIKAAGIAMKWSSYSKKWVRKHTASTNSSRFVNELKKALEQTTYE